MDSYRVEKEGGDEDSASRMRTRKSNPVPMEGGGPEKPEPKLDRLSNILKTFNDHLGTLFNDSDRVFKAHHRRGRAPKVASNQAYQNAKMNTPHTAHIAHDKALEKVMQTFP